MAKPAKLLLGKWKSDKRRTLQTCHKYHCLRGLKKRRFAALFGRLELRYTEKFVYSKLRDFRYRERYDVIAEDSESIALRIHCDGLKKQMHAAVGTGFDEFFKPGLSHLHFARYRGRQYYWIGLGNFCEWFRKVETVPART